MNKKLKKILESPILWPVLGCIILYILICAVSGSISLRVITSGLKLCVFAMLLGMAQMLVVTSGKGAIDISQKYLLTLAAYVSCAVMQNNIILGLLAAIAVGMLCGLINAGINVFLNIHAMITTMATGYLYYTAILLISNRVTNSRSVGIQYDDNHGGRNSSCFVLCLISYKIWYESTRCRTETRSSKTCRY